MAANKTNANIIAGVLAVVGVYVIYRLFISTPKVKAASGGGYSAGGGNVYYPYPQQQQQDGSLAALLAKLLGQQKQGSSKSGSGSNPLGSTGNASQAIKNGGNMTVAQALAGGFYNADTANTLAGIFNIQHGAGDFEGDSHYDIGNSWLDSGMGLGNLFASENPQIDYEDSNMGLLDLSAIASPLYGDDYSTDANAYADTTYGNYFDDTPTIDVGDYGGGDDWSNYDWGGGSGGGGSYDNPYGPWVNDSGLDDDY